MRSATGAATIIVLRAGLGSNAAVALFATGEHAQSTILTAAVALPCFPGLTCRSLPGVLPLPTHSLKRGSHLQVEQAPASGQPAVAGTLALEERSVAVAVGAAKASPVSDVHSPKLSSRAPAENPAQQILEDPKFSQVTCRKLVIPTQGCFVMDSQPARCDVLRLVSGSHAWQGHK